MSNKEYKEMLRMVFRLKKLIDRYEDFLEVTSPKKEESELIMIPPDVYDDICEELGTNQIGLMGIS